jgi:uncharacterized membrane protein
MPEKPVSTKEKMIAAAVLAALFFAFYNIFSYLVMKKLDFPASLFGASIFWIMYFIILVLKGKNTGKKKGK